ncbi:unnamed protein product [Schistocephalus solidus]|uniref:DUF3778 domain-containing protein n=1 Tax=Schistocephalus solidus TaxID=70667 RepID=A0A183TDI6_SCHSO|nr:unnamed protein product [Schistocephalus solidus]
MVATPVMLQLFQLGVDSGRPVCSSLAVSGILSCHPSFSILRRQLKWKWLSFVQVCSKQQRWQDNSFGAEVEPISIPNDVLHTSEGLTGFDNPLGGFIVNFGATLEVAVQVGEGIYRFHLGAVGIDANCVVGGIGRRLMHEHSLLRVDAHSEVVTMAAKKTMLLCMSLSVVAFTT